MEHYNSRNLLARAADGIFVLTAYALVEFLFTGVATWLATPAHSYVPAHPAFSLFLICCYILAGAALGALVALLPPNRHRRICLLIAIVVTAFSLNLTIRIPASLTRTMVFATNGTLLGLLALAAWRPGRISRLVHPVAAFLIVIAPIWITQEYLATAPKLDKAMASAATIGIVAMLAFFLASESDHQRSVRAMLVLAISALLITLTFRQQPIHAASPRTDSRLEGQPNVILISLDTVRADHLSVYGYQRPTTPTLAAFARDAVLYTRAIAASDYTLPTHASLFTGLYPRSHGARTDLGGAGDMPLDERHSTLAEILRKRGYYTMGVVANHGYLSPGFGVTQGFTHYDNIAPASFWAKPQRYYLRRLIRDVVAGLAGGESDRNHFGAEEINRRVFILLDEASRSRQPFFLFVNYMDAHFPYLPPAPYDALYPGKQNHFSNRRYRALAEQVSQKKRRIRSDERAHLESQYDGGIQYLDSELASLFRNLKALRMYDRSMIVVTSDHGESFGDNDFIGHGNGVHAAETWIPLIVKYPGNHPTGIDARPTSSVDLLPTVLDVLGAKYQVKVEGASLREKASNTPALSESYPNIELQRWSKRFKRVQRAILGPGHKLIVSYPGIEELYSSGDPLETFEIRAREPQAGQTLRRTLDQWIASTKPFQSEARPDLGTLERLRGIGYIQ